MSNVRDTDTYIVSREGTEFKVKSEDTSNLRDTDLFWVQRSGVNYSVTADQVNAGSKAEEPELSLVTLTKTTTGDRYTDQSFLTAPSYTTPGNPPPTTGLKAKVTGALSIAGASDEIVGIDSQSLTVTASPASGWGAGGGYTNSVLTGISAVYDGVPLASKIKVDGSMQDTSFVMNYNDDANAFINTVYDPPIVTDSLDVYSGIYSADSSDTGTVTVTFNDGTTSIQNVAGGPSFNMSRLIFPTGGKPVVSVRCDGFYSNYGGASTNGRDGLVFNAVNTILTLASDANLETFKAGNLVKQNNSPIVPVSSAITDVSTTQEETAIMYSMSSIPTNLASIPSEGTLVTGQESVTGFLVIVHQAAAQDGASVFSANGDSSFNINNTTVGSGHYDASGTRLGGAGSYNSSEWVLFNYGGSVDDSYSIPLSSAYTVFGRGSSTGTIGSISLAPTTTLTLTDASGLSDFEVGDVVQASGPPTTALVYAQANDEDQGSYFNYFFASPEFQTAGWKITDFLDETLIGTSFTFSYFWSNDGVNWTKGGNYDSTSSPGAFPVDDSGYGAFTIYGQSGVGNAKISLRGVRYGGTVGTLPTANPFATDVSVTSTNLSTPSINTSGGDWIGTDGTGNTAWNQSQVWSQNNTGFAAAGLAMDAFDGSTVDTGYNRAYAAAMGTYATVTFASAITVSTSLRVWVGSGATQPNLLKINGNAISGSFPSVAGGWFTVPGISSLSSISVGRNSDGTYGDYTSLYAVEVDGQMLVDSGVSGAPETKVTGPVKTITQSGPYITFSETTGRWLVTQSDYDAAKKLDTTVRVPLVLDASNTAHVALFNAMNTKFTAFPTARQTFIDALRTKIIGLTLTTPELEVLCGTAKTLVKRHVITIANNKFYIDGVLQATLSLKKGTTYIFDQDEATNSGHTLKLYTDANKTTEYTSGVTVIGTPGGATSRTTFVVPSNAPAVLYYQSTAAASMGGQLNIS